jgi:hypothetical protein
MFLADPDSITLGVYGRFVVMETDNVLFNLQLPRSVRDDFRVVAKLRGTSMAALLHQFMYRTIRDEKDRRPEAFPDYTPEPPPVPDVSDKDKQVLDIVYESFGGEEVQPDLLKAVLEAVKMLQAATETDVPVLPKRITVK